MSTVPAEPSVPPARYPVPSGTDGSGWEARLRRLIGRGFRFVHPRDEHGEVVAVVGVRPHRDVVDVVCLRAPDDVTATRVPGDEDDVLHPARPLWSSAGASEPVLDELLALPDERFTGTVPGKTVTGCWVAVEPGRAAWLAGV